MIKNIRSTHPKLVELFQVISYYVEFHSIDKLKPNRRFRRMIEKGVKVGKNRTTLHSIRNGSLNRKRLSFY